MRHIAEKLFVPFVYFPCSFEAHESEDIQSMEAGPVVLSEWLRLAKLDPWSTTNIHPAPLPRFGGKGMHGRKLHEAVLSAFRRGEISVSAVTMHFAKEQFLIRALFSSVSRFY